MIVLMLVSITRMAGTDSQMRGLQIQVNGSHTQMDRHCKSNARS